MTVSMMDTILNSEKRKNVMLLLMDGKKCRDEIKTSLNVTSTALIPQIKKLKEHGLVIQDVDDYTLSNMGKVIVENMLPLLKTVDVFEANERYWQNRNLNGVPKSILKRIGELDNCIIIEPDLNHLFEFPKEFTENITKSNYIMVYNAYFHPDCPSLYSSLVEKGIDSSIILTKSVFERMEKDYLENVQKFVDIENCNLFVSKEVTGLATLVTTDRFLYLCFFDKNGQYDNRIIMSFDSTALKWSRDLFNCYKEEAEMITELNI